MRKIVFMLCLALFCAVTAVCAPIYKYEDTVPITDTVSLTRVREFHADKNISYSYIKADLTDEKIDLTLLKSAEGTDILNTVENLAATNENTVAAVNGDFFSIYSGNKGFSLGIEYQDGIMYESPINPETMATVAYDGVSLLMDYFDYNLEIVSPSGKSANVRHVNKHTSYYGDILMYTSTFNGGYSPAPGGEVVEVVIEDNTVVEFRRNMESVEIPENGCVLVVSEGINMFLANNFNVGDEIVFKLNVSPSLEDVRTAFGGGSMLVFEGQDVGKIGDYTHTVAGLNPRTAIGVDATGTTLYLVAVDGRQTGSAGMRMSHLAELLISLGCYNAVNLDGGGSTRMMASTLNDGSMHTVNNPTENRKVINAVGITLTPTENAGSPVGMMLSVDKEYAFVGQPVVLSAILYDDSMRQVKEYDGEIEFESDFGYIEDGVLYCDEGVTVTVKAVYENVENTVTVDFIDSVSGIETVKSLKMKKGEEYKIEIGVFDELGRNVSVDDCSMFSIVSTNPDIVSVEDGVIKAENNGVAQITVERGGAISVINVAVGYYTFDYYYGFEQNDGSLVTYPKDVKGEYTVTDEIRFSGSFSGKLSYDFRPEDDGLSEYEISDDFDGMFDIIEEYTAEKNEKKISEDGQNSVAEKEETVADEAADDVARAVYFALNKGVRVADDCTAIRMNIYVEDDFKHTVKAQFTDGNGKIAIIPFEGRCVAGTWRGFAANIPEDMAMPLTLTRVYVLYTPGEKKDKGEIYFDDLAFVTAKDYLPRLPADDMYVNDLSNSNVDFKFRIGTLPSENKKTPLTNVVKDRVKRYVGEYENGLLMGGGGQKGITIDNNCIYVRLDTSSGGIRKTDSEQWNNLYNAIYNNSNAENIFIIAENGIYGDDEFENEVVGDFLSECGKNVFVITAGDDASYENVNGVKYITLDNTPDDAFDGMISQSNSVVEFSVGDNVTFELKSV